MGAVRKYEVTVNGHETIMKLSDKDAERYPGAQLVVQSAPAADDESGAKSRTPANKARRQTGDK